MLIKNLSFLGSLEMENQKIGPSGAVQTYSDYYFWYFLSQNSAGSLSFGGFTLETPKKWTFRQDDFLDQFFGFPFPNYPESLSF